MSEILPKNILVQTSLSSKAFKLQMFLVIIDGTEKVKKKQLLTENMCTNFS